MLFQLMKHETSYTVAFTVMDRDKMSGNDLIASTNFPVQKLMAAAPEADPQTGLYKLSLPQDVFLPPSVKEKSRFKIPLSRSSSATSLQKVGRPPLNQQNSQASLSSMSQLDFSIQDTNADTPKPAPTSQPSSSDPNLLSVPSAGSDIGATSDDPDLTTYVIPLELKNKDRWEDKHNPEIHVKAKFLPYRALRQQFWRAMLRQYDTDESGHVSKIELTSMLDTLGSTLKESTIDGFFRSFSSEDQSAESLDLTFDQAIICLEEKLEKSSQVKGMGQRIKDSLHTNPPDHQDSISNAEPKDIDLAGPKAEESDRLSTNADPNRSAAPTISQNSLGSKGEEGQYLHADDLGEDSNGEEHVVEIRECPICHQPRLDKRTDADIITHIATCASQDWRQVNNFVMGGFVTSSQAQRKWYSKVITKISYGGYKLGANSANILVQDRITGQISEERMSVYVRLGIRLLYKALGAREMEKKRSKWLST